MKITFSQAPFIRISIPLILGIIVSVYHSYFSLNILLFISFIILLTLITNYFFNKYILFKNRIFNISIFAIFFLLGYSLSSYKTETINSLSDKGTFLFKVIKNPQSKNNSIKITGEILAKQDSNKLITLNNYKTILFIKNDSNKVSPKINDYIIINTTIKEIENAKNPEQFNYKKYLFFNGIKSGAFVKTNNWRLIKNNEFNIFKLSNDIRNLLLSKLDNFNFSNKNKAIIAAISLGKRDDIDTITNEQFSNAGVMHILAVSGLHVGIVFLILISIFKPLLKYKNGKIISYIIIVLLLWVYAFITGLTPSVVRAVLMFSLVSIGKVFNKQHNIYNTIFASAFILLIVNPFYIMQLGFQLSYLAVIGIIFFQPKISSLIKSDNRIINYFWGIISVSIAAQIATAPITILYFHKFPVYFLLSNIAVMFNVTLILIISFVFFATFFIPYLNILTSEALNAVTSALNLSIKSINNLPFPIIDNINWDINLALISYVILLLFGFYIIYRNKYIFSTMLLSTILIFAFINYYKYNNFKRNEISFYSINQHTIIAFTSKCKTNLLIDRNYKKLKKDIKFNIKDHITNTGSVITKTGLIKYTQKNDNIFRRKNFIKYREKSFFVYNGEKIYDTTAVMNIDYLVINKYNSWTFKNVLKKFNPKTIILSTKLWPNNILELNSILNKQEIHNIKTLNYTAFIDKIK